jgi:hypothetical protein
MFRMEARNSLWSGVIHYTAFVPSFTLINSAVELANFIELRDVYNRTVAYDFLDGQAYDNIL